VIAPLFLLPKIGEYMSIFDDLVGLSVIGVDTSDENHQYLKISDGRLVQIETAPDYELDCCGYNEAKIKIPESFDFNDNVITKVEYNDNGKIGEYDPTDYVHLGIFASNKVINIDGEAGSGSGWNYGQFVEIDVIAPE